MPWWSPERRFVRFRRRGDADALARVFDETAPEVLRVALHLARDPAEAEDLLQRTFLTAIERAAAYDPRKRLVPWLPGVCTCHEDQPIREAETHEEAA